MSRWRESSGRSSGSQIVPPGESSSGRSATSLTRFSKSAILASRRVSPSRMNGQPYTGANTMWSPPMCAVLLGVARLQLELARGLGHLLEDELGVEADAVLVLDDLTGASQQVDRLGEEELDPDLGDEPPPAAIDHGHRVFAEDLVAGHRVDEQGWLLAFGGGIWVGGPQLGG